MTIARVGARILTVAGSTEGGILSGIDALGPVLNLFLVQAVIIISMTRSLTRMSNQITTS